MANKKITELPFINTITGSSVWDNPNYNSVVPVVLYGTTNQITVENFAKHINLYNAHTGSAGNTFAGPQTINNNVTINGRLTVREVVAQYETASVLFSTGSTKLGDEITDKHELTGSTNITGSLVYNGVLIGNIDSNTIYRLQQATASIELASASFKYFYQSTSSLQSFTASQADRNLVLSTVTGSINQATQSLQTFTASQADRNLVLSTVTGSINQFTASQDNRNFVLGIVTGSLNQFTASQDSRNFVISQYTASTDAHIVGIAAFTSSQLAVNLGNAIYTASVDSHIVGISTYTSSVRDTLARVHQSTASLQSFTASQDSRNFTLSQVTGSLIGITNGLMAFTAALDNTYATDAQLYQLYQATRSIELHSGSMIGITNGLMAYTSSNETWKTGVRGEINGIEAYTGSNETWKTGVRGEISAIEAWTASLDNTYATDAQLYQLYAATASLNTTTGSIKGELAGLESYTASLKAAAIVSSSTQITNYYKFAETASANTFYGNQTFNSDVRANKFVFTDGVINTNVGGQYVIATSGNVTYLYTGTSGLNINDATNGNINVSISNAGVVQTRGKLTVGSPGNDQDIAFGGSNAKLDWAGSGAQIQYSVGALQFSSVGTTNNMILQQQAGALFNAGITGSLMATNGVVSSSAQLPQIAGLQEYTASLKGAIEISGQNVNVLGMITAQQFNVTYVSSSVMYQSGSTKVGNTFDDKHEFTGSVKISGSFEVQGTDTGASVGDLLVDSINKYVYVGRQSVTSGDNTTLVLRDRTGTARATLPAGGSYDTIFTTNASNFKVTNYSGTNLLNVSNIGNVTASGTFTIGGQTQIGTATTDTSLGSNTKLKTVGDGNVNAGASQGSMFVAAGVTGGDTGLPVNMGTAGASMMLLASINTSTGTSTNAAQYLLHFYFDGNNLPNVMYVTGSSNWATFSVTSNNTLAISGSSSGNKSYAWWINKFGA